ncbi:3-phosphoshikimate 1-carboxyvinyltransferase [Candidatus Zinderia endosymbiont of Aphrophora alni]|uniref:3-phosphoshikimate 1-carboxyvinyltransferase n=1 Tax=Candidatus Zinderia endosymbiont of Aphrophora alni TaxID=3077951 RepID=UPI0030D41864
MSYINLYLNKNFKKKIKLPGSKSISNRILLLSSLSKGITIIKEILISEDTLVMFNILKNLGINLYFDYINNNFIIYGCKKNFPIKKNNLFVGNAGTVIRPLISILSILGGEYILFGTKRMHNRPIKDLIVVLKKIGMNIKYLKNIGYPPLYISYGKFKISKLNIKCDISSQFLTSLLIGLGLLSKKYKFIFIKILGKLTSKPYIYITINLMKIFGINVIINNNILKIFLNSGYNSPGIFLVEGDVSSASYFLAAGVISGSLIKVKGIGRNSIQGDMKIINILRMMGGIINVKKNYIESFSKDLLYAINIDCNDFPDSAMVIAIISLYTNNINILRNISNWKFKESNRLFAMKKELSKLGAKVSIGEDFIKIIPPKFIKSAIIDTYDDHRIAMCFSLVSLNTFLKYGVFIRINNPKCVCKTFPNFFLFFNKKNI